MPMGDVVLNAGERLALSYAVRNSFGGKEKKESLKLPPLHFGTETLNNDNKTTDHIT